MSKPLTKEEFIIRHSAYFQNFGFDVQFAAFIYYSLDIGYEDAIHYESEEDYWNGCDCTLDFGWSS